MAGFVSGAPSQLSFMGVRLDVFSNVYTPAEDSFLLAKHAREIQGNVLELGTGCGIASLVNASRNPENYVLGVDINPYAVRNSEYNARQNRITNAGFARSNLFSHIPKLRFDGILFNPPYLPSNDEFKEEHHLRLALDGGKDGREVIDRFISALPSHLLPGGKALMVQSSINGLSQTICLAQENGLSVEIVEEQPFFFEKLHLLEFRNSP
ncbi:MAG: methyltransferase [Candidatus Bilamarchaeaceae archaeon]